MVLTTEQIQANKQQIIDLLLSTKREGIEKLLEYLEQTNFFILPSSFSRHHNWQGGLAHHCLGVYNCAIKSYNSLSESEKATVNVDSIIISALMHDLCKVDKFYYDSNFQLRPSKSRRKGHGSLSVILVQECGVVLTEQERRAIRWHMRSRKIHNQQEWEDYQIAQNELLKKLVFDGDKLDARTNSFTKWQNNQSGQYQQRQYNRYSRYGKGGYGRYGQRGRRGRYRSYGYTNNEPEL